MEGNRAETGHLTLPGALCKVRALSAGASPGRGIDPN